MHSVGSKQEELEPPFSRKLLMLSQKHGGMTLIMGVLQWVDISSLEETGETEEVVG